jgi:hypothetical protein
MLYALVDYKTAPKLMFVIAAAVKDRAFSLLQCSTAFPPYFLQSSYISLTLV